MTSSWYSNDKYANVRAGAQRTYRVTRAAAELAVSTDNVRRQQGVGAVRGGADVALKYRNLKAEAGFKTLPIEEKLFKIAGDTMTVTGGVLSAIALPTMAKKAATSFKELSTLIHDPTATANARLDKVEELTRASAGTIFAAQGVVMGAKGTVGILARSEGIARVVAKVSEGPLMKFVGSPLGKALNILLPVADAAVLVGEGIATRRAFTDPTATTSHKLRKVLDLSLAGVKVAFWLLPGAKALKGLYTIASFGQLALTLKDYWPQIQPNIVKVAKAVGWGVTHPIEAMGKIAEGTVGAAKWTGGKVGAFLGWTWDKLTHPVQTWNNLWTEVSAWSKAYFESTGRQVVGWFGGTPAAPGQPVVPGQPAATQLAYAAPAPMPGFPLAAPVAPVAAQPAPAALPADAIAATPVAAPPPPAPAPPPPPPAPVPPAPEVAPVLAAAPAAPALPAVAAPVVAAAPALAAAAPAADPLAQIRQAAEAGAATA